VSEGEAVAAAQAAQTAQAATVAAQTRSLGQLAGDNWPILLFGLVVFALVLRWRLRRVDPLTKAHRWLTEEAARFEASQGRTDAEQLVRVLPCPQSGLPLGYAPPQPWRPWRCRQRPYRPVGLRWESTPSGSSSSAPPAPEPRGGRSTRSPPWAST